MPSLITGVGIVVFALIWELRWSRLLQTLAEHRSATAHWTKQALHDPLTSLPNRTLLRDRLEQALFRASRNGTCIGVLFIDLDNFKAVNDSFGHFVGDQVLVATGERLRGQLRAGDTAARVGGDEYVVLLELKSPDDPVVMIAERLRYALQTPLLQDPAPITLNASIGIAISEAGDYDPDELLQKADRALIGAKRIGKDRVVFHSVTEHVELVASVAMD
jgi:diguanylate cyclase